MFRNPIDQMISMFGNWHRYKGLAGWGIEIPYSSKIKFKEFIFKLPNYQSRFVGNYHFKPEDIICTTNNVNVFAGRILAYLKGHQYQEVQVGRRNETRRKPTLEQLGISKVDQPDFLKQFELLNRQDYDLLRDVRDL